MSLIQEPIIEQKVVSQLVKEVIIGFLTIFVALSVKEFMVTLMHYILPNPGDHILVLQGFIAAFSLLITVILATVWQ